MRKQFTFYRSFWDTIQKLPTNKEKLQCFQILCAYALDEKMPDLNAAKPSAAMVFSIAQPVLDKALERSKRALVVNSSDTVW